MPRIITAPQIKQSILNAYRDFPFQIDPQVLKLISSALQSETDPGAQSILQSILENAKLAREEHLVPCQDTGTQIFFIELGTEVLIEGGTLEQIINGALAQASRENFLRASIVQDPLFDRINSGDNTPGVFHVKQAEGDRLRIRIAQKGGGAENMSRLFMLTPASGPDAIEQLVLQVVREAGSKACPPLIIGIGIGGNFETAPLLAKSALLTELEETNPIPDYAALEQRLLEAVNSTGIGPMGLGGKTTALRVLIRTAPCHIASLPLAINLQCHSHKHTEILL